MRRCRAGAGSAARRASRDRLRPGDLARARRRQPAAARAGGGGAATPSACPSSRTATAERVVERRGNPRPTPPGAATTVAVKSRDRPSTAHRGAPLPRRLRAAGAHRVDWSAPTRAGSATPPRYGQSLVADLVQLGAAGAAGPPRAHARGRSRAPNCCCGHAAACRPSRRTCAAFPILGWMNVYIGDPLMDRGAAAAALWRTATATACRTRRRLSRPPERRTSATPTATASATCATPTSTATGRRRRR